MVLCDMAAKLDWSSTSAEESANYLRAARRALTAEIKEANSETQFTGKEFADDVVVTSDLS